MASTTVASNAIVLEVLDQHNYDDWSSRVKTYLLAEDLWDVVKAEPPEPKDKAWTTNNAKALHAIKISCGTLLFSFIRETHTAKIAWELLEKKFKSLNTLRLEKKEREERERSLQTRDEGQDLVQANEDLEIRASEGGNENNVHYEYFFDYVMNGDWDNAKMCLDTLHSDAVRARIPHIRRCTALHLSAQKGHVHIIKELASLMTQEDLEINDDDGYTALHEAVFMGNVEIVKELAPLMRRQGLVKKNKSGATAFHLAALNGHADIVKELLRVMTPEDLKIKETTKGRTALHIAVLKENVDIVKDLLAVMRPEDLEVKDSSGYTALHRAVMVGNVDRTGPGVVWVPNLIRLASEISGPALNVDIVKELVLSMREEALEIKDGYGFTPLGRAIKRHRGGDQKDVIKMTKYMVEKNQKILSIVIPPQNFIPVVEACIWERWELASYLYSVTPFKALTPPENGLHGASLIWFCLKSKKFDIAWHLLSRCPSLTIVDTVTRMGSPIVILSRMHFAFLRDLRLRFWQKWIYEYYIRIQLSSADSNNQDISIHVSNSEDDRGNQRGLISSVISLLRRPKKDLLELLGINGIYELTLTHDRILRFIRCMGEATINMEELTLAQLNLLNKSMFEAIEQGNVEFVTCMCKANPNLVNMLGDKQRSIFHYAIECRQEKIYNLIYGLKKEDRNVFGINVASFNNTMLHGAGNLSPLPQFRHIQGASLQMQRELQWFKEVESVVPIELHESRNFSDNLTARELFHKNHKRLMEEAELSMKGIATSCTFVGALIVTIMFAAAFTVPGGNNVNTGLPMFIHENLFLVFIVSDTTALVSSITAVIIFLGILTSRYSEDDYLKKLPRNMMIGLFTLFISIATMMTAFSCGLVIMLRGRYSWVAIPSILVASIPVISFLWMLFPLLVQTFISTYGSGIFNRKVKPLG